MDNNKSIIILGDGAREVSIARALSNTYNILIHNKSNNKSSKNIQLQLVYGQDCYLPEDTLENNIQKLIDNNVLIEYIVVGNEFFFTQNLHDISTNFNIPVIGPTKGFKLELSKYYARQITEEVDDSFNPQYMYLDSNYNCNNFIQDWLYNHEFKYYKKNEFVIKPDGLTGGKGVKLFPENISSNGVVKYIPTLDKCLIEETLRGEEFSLMAFTDGTTVKFMPLVKDFKRAYNDDKGDNTGSMGSISVPEFYFLNDDELTKCKNFMEKLISYMKRIGTTYKGVLYGSFMKTNDNKLKLIEFNCRFGDPECINVLNLLETPLDLIFKHIINNNLNELEIQYKNECQALIYIVPSFYPVQEMNDNIRYKLNRNLLATDVFYTKDIKSYFENANIYVSSLNHASNTLNLSLTTSRSYAILFSGETLQDCASEISRFFNCHPLNDTMFRRRTDIISNYIDKKNKYKYTSIANIDTNFVNDCLLDVKSEIQSTYTQEVKGEFGDFSGKYDISNIANSCGGKVSLMASTDGVGTKNILLKKVFGPTGYFVCGQDLVNHNINDILVDGGYPMFFLDYYGCHQLNKQDFSYFIKGVSKACRENEVALIGGETAVMKDTFKEGTDDLNGTIVGYHKFKFNPELITSGDVLIGIPSSGFHTNGYSLLRKQNRDYLKSIENILAEPHRCYLSLIKKCNEFNIQIKGLSHITGGGYHDNLKRVVKIPYTLNNFTFPAYYNQLLETMTREECLSIFNCGFGLVIITSLSEFEHIKKIEINAEIIGSIN